MGTTGKLTLGNSGAGGIGGELFAGGGEDGVVGFINCGAGNVGVALGGAVVLAFCAKPGVEAAPQPYHRQVGAVNDPLPG
jgi:hypothetical protein